jgi:hypothetical protein
MIEGHWEKGGLPHTHVETGSCLIKKARNDLGFVGTPLSGVVVDLQGQEVKKGSIEGQ